MQASDAVERLCGALERESVYPLQINHSKKREFATAIRTLLAAIEAKDAEIKRVRKALRLTDPDGLILGRVRKREGIDAAALTAPAQADAS